MFSLRKTFEQCRLCPKKSRILCTLPRKLTEPSYFTPQNNGAMQTLPRKSRRHSLRARIPTKFILNLIKVSFFHFFVLKSTLLQRFIEPLGPPKRENKFVVTVSIITVFPTETLFKWWFCFKKIMYLSFFFIAMPFYHQVWLRGSRDQRWLAGASTWLLVEDNL